MKHTPGPWKTHNNIGKKGELGIIADEAPCIIAIMGNQEAWPREAEANARLIAAAPDYFAIVGAVLDDETLTAEHIRNMLSPVQAKAKGE